MLAVDLWPGAMSRVKTDSVVRFLGHLYMARTTMIDLAI
jgi:hypothetical protein